MKSIKVQTIYFDYIKCGKKKYEGRLKTKVEELDLKIGSQLRIEDASDSTNFIEVDVISIEYFRDFGEAYDKFGNDLIPDSSKSEVIKLYNKFYQSQMISDVGVAIIGIKI